MRTMCVYHAVLMLICMCVDVASALVYAAARMCAANCIPYLAGRQALAKAPAQPTAAPRRSEVGKMQCPVPHAVASLRERRVGSHVSVPFPAMADHTVTLA